MCAAPWAVTRAGHSALGNNKGWTQRRARTYLYKHSTAILLFNTIQKHHGYTSAGSLVRTPTVDRDDVIQARALWLEHLLSIETMLYKRGLSG